MRHMGRPAAGAPCLAALFDFDGTLVLTTAGVEQTWTSWAHRHGLEPSAVLTRIHGRRTEEIMRELLPAGDAGRRADELEAEIVRTTDARPVAAICRLYRGLPDDRRAIVTSARAMTVRSHLHTQGLEVPRVLVAAEDVARGKPDPEPYRLAASRLNLHPDQCVVVEDAPAGVRSGVAAGMTVVGVTSSHPAEALLSAGASAALAPAAAAARIGRLLDRTPGPRGGLDNPDGSSLEPV